MHIFCFAPAVCTALTQLLRLLQTKQEVHVPSVKHSLSLTKLKPFAQRRFERQFDTASHDHRAVARWAGGLARFRRYLAKKPAWMCRPRDCAAGSGRGALPTLPS